MRQRGIRYGREWAWVLAASLLVMEGRATTIHVATNGLHQSPFDTWGKAATNIHDAVALAANLDVVLVSNGTYRLTNTLVVATNITIQGVGGPAVTTVQPTGGVFHVMTVTNDGALVAGFTLRGGGGSGNYTVRAVQLNKGTVSNCTITASGGGITVFLYGRMTRCVITNNSPYALPVDVYSGGVLEDSTVALNSAVETGGIRVYSGGTVRRCRIYSNWCNSYGPKGVQLGGRMENSLVYSNWGPGDFAGGVAVAGGSAVMENCTVFGNTALGSSGGAGVKRSSGTIRNCILYGNIGPSPANYQGAVTGAVYYSCAPELMAGFQGNIIENPMLVNAPADFRLRTGSPCRDAGTNLVSIVSDIDGASRPQDGGTGGGMRHDMGAYEMNGTTGAFDVGFYGVEPLGGIGSLAVILRANAVGADRTVTWYGWDFNNDGVFETNGVGLAVVTNTFVVGGYSVSLWVSNSVGGVAAATNLACVTVVGMDLHVATNGTHESPYDTWAKAATNVHSAVDLAVGGCTVHIGNGSFPTTKRIVLAQSIRVVGNGPDFTTLRRHAAAGNFGVFSLEHAGARVDGLTITNGYGTTVDPAAVKISGGIVSNCVITRNNSGGGGADSYWNPVKMSGGLMTHCSIVSNGTYNGAATVSGGIIQDSLIGWNHGTDRGGLLLGGGGTGRRLRIIGNTANGNYGPAGIVLQGVLENSLVYGNTHAQTASAGGVDMSGGRMIHCTIVGNSNAAASAMGSGLRRTGGVVTNSIVYGNFGSGGSNYVGAASAAWYSCVPELTAGVQGNLAGDPAFNNPAKGDFRLKSGSLCINAGTNLAASATGLDLDGLPRLMQRAVDMGAYEVIGRQGAVVILL